MQNHCTIPQYIYAMIENKKKHIEISNKPDTDKSKQQMMLFKTAILKRDMDH